MSRSSYLQLTELQVLTDWSRLVHASFKSGTYGPYLVGSCITRKDYKDVDLRIIMEDKTYDKLSKIIDIHRFNISTSLWGQKVTGLPVDLQIQRMTEANDQFPGTRHAIWIGGDDGI